MTETLRTWERVVDCRAGRREALRAAIAELPFGVTWDLVIRHQDGCDTLAEWSDGLLGYCNCETLILEAREWPKMGTAPTDASGTNAYKQVRDACELAPSSDPKGKSS